MLKIILKSINVLILTLAIPLLSVGQDTPPATEKGIDERINEAFQPVTDATNSIVFYSVNIGGASVPIIVIILALGALSFTLLFRFVNLKQFGLAIKVVRGKYDDLEKDAPDVNPANVNVSGGDVVDTIKNEAHHGEVNHFQALATAVSGTVGLGNIAGVAVAIAIGGPGATFWMIVCGLLGMSSKFVECTLGVKYRDIDKNGVVYGGPMYYLKKGLA